MSRLAQYLAAYGKYHRDRRNVVTHLVGIPMIVLAVVILLSRPVFAFGGVPFTPALVAIFLAGVWYLQLDLRFGLVMATLLALAGVIGADLAASSTTGWLSWGIGLFVAGWAIQFIGHGFEGRKPAFFDDLKSLLVGPLFVVAEVAFLLGLLRKLKAEMDQAAG